MIERSVETRTSLSGFFFLLLLGGSIGLQYQPVEIFAGGEDCALVLNGPGRTSSFDYTFNLLRGSFPSNVGGQSCITYEAINHAYVEARKRIHVAQPTTEIWRPEELATVGELLLDISTQIAQMYGLTYEEVEKSLPLIDTSKTLIQEICPAYLSDVECRAGKYRRYDGLCTNLENPTWGASLSPFVRLMPPRFSDGMSAPRIATSGRNLPLSRVVSRTMHPDEGYHDHAGTVMVIAWGQFMDHDYTLTGTPLDPFNRNDPEECCNRPPHQKHPYCNEIRIPDDDYFYRLFNVRCIDFVRAFPAARPGCRLGSRVPFNLLTGVLDGNTVYGVTEVHSRKLRTGYAGLLRMNPVFSEYGLKDLLPLKLDIPDEGCTRPNQSMYCFEAGEIRVNEQLVLTCMHTLMAREHNRAAKALSQVNPHWDDETLFQEARRIVIAEIQHVTYNEFLPILLGKDVMEKFGLLLEKDRYWDGYDSTVNPGVIDAFASAAFRFGHSLLPTAVERWSKAHKFIASKRLSDLIRRPYDLYRAGVLDEYFMGLMNQVAQAMDDSITQEVTNHLFKKVGAKFGMDLVSFNMQRGREFGIPSYMEFRKFCGLPGADTFEELFGSMPNETIRRYSSIFEHPNDVDLWSGGVSERPLPGSMLGPTFACVIATQFSNSRRGDRFWYELPNQPSSFTIDQLNEIRKGRLARLICDNTDLIDTIQIYPMVLPDHEINPRVPCRSGILPGIDFSKWAEYPTNERAPYDCKDKTSTKSKPIYSKFTRNNLDTIEKKNSQSTTNLNLKVENSASNSMSPKTELKLDLENPSSIDALKITTIVEIMRDKGKAKENAVKTRLKRETSTTLAIAAKPHDDSKIGISLKPQLKKLYRHPRLTLEEQKKSATKIKSPLDNGFKYNLKDFETKYGVENIKVPHPFTFLAPSLALAAYNDTISSEVDDLNIPPPRPIKRKTVIPEVDIKFPLSTKNSPKSPKVRNLNSKQNFGDLLPRSFQSPHSIPLAQETKNSTYINLEDHRKDLNEGKVERKTVPGYPSDIPPYNPDIIPYVEVPDYSDRRQESLDKEDQDFVDPTAPLLAGTKDVDAVKGTLKPKGSTQTPYYDIEENEQIKDVGSEKLEAIPVHETEESEVDTQEPSVESKAKEEKAEDFEPINFDINDYKKPFNFKELFKELNLPLDDEDEDQKEEKEEAEGTYSEKYADPSQESSTTEAYSSFEHEYDKNEKDSEKETENSSEIEKEEEKEDDDHTSEDSKTVKITEDEFKYGDKDFFKPFFGEKPKRSSHEFYYDGDKEQNSRREASNRKEILAKGYGIDVEKLPPLSDILAKKDSFSRLSKNVDRDAKKSGKIPKEYKNEWVLEYEFPKKKEGERRT